ncbi:Ig-like domain-containing protein [Kitasatospora sp. NBC_01539]|uniref:Ig-like domain-containing protein n=1 Tax=Kitasatospora sp. NBC_01539 TaxID=2903577 RepID=UPI00386015A2
MNRRFRPSAPVSGAGRRTVEAPRPARTRRPAAAALAAALLALSAGVADAQQSPAAWGKDRRAVLPSGLAVQMDFSPLPGVAASAAPGTLGRRAGAGEAYTDGIRPGDPAETFRIGGDRPSADGSWRTLGELRITFSRSVRNPRLHVSGLTARATGAAGTTATAARLTVTGATPTAPTLVGRTAWTGWTAAGNELAPPADANADTAADGTGTVELAGTLSGVTLRIEQRTTARNGSTTPPPALVPALTVTLDESLGTAPQSYGNASHVLSDLYLGQDAADEAHRSRAVPPPLVRPLVPAPPADGPGAAVPPGGTSADRTDAGGRPEVPATRPLVELAPGAGGRSIWASPVPPRTGPGRAPYQGADPTLVFPADAVTGGTYGLDVPVATGGGAAVLAGWVDFDRNGRFDALERVQTEVAAGADAARLEWTVQGRVVPGDTWARLRIGRDASQMVDPAGFADSGQVSDQRIRLAPGPVRPEITLPVDGTATADVRPQVAGAGTAGAAVAVTDGAAAVCRATAGQDGTWGCRPDAALAEGPHALVAEESATGGAVRRSEPVRLTVKTAPPAAPVLTLPEYTNDPGLLVTGRGEPGSTVSVTEPPGSTRIAGELCSTGVGADGTWSCLPVEPLDEGAHRLTAKAVDAAGNTATGRPTALTVDTVAPGAPALASPRAGESVPSRPRFGGRAEAAATVTVTARTGGGERTTLCSGTAAADGAWSCVADAPMAVGEQVVSATATDRAGNGAAAAPVVVHVTEERPGPAEPSVDPSAVAAAPTGGTPAAGAPPVSPSPTVSGEPGAPSPAAVLLAHAMAPPPDRTALSQSGGEGLHLVLYVAMPLVTLTAGLLLRRMLARGSGARRR